MKRFAGQICLVTGAGSGIGRATAIKFAAEGAKVVVSDLNEAAGCETVDMIAAAGGEAVFVCCDIAERDQVENLLEKTIRTYARLDCAVNSAGIAGSLSTPTHEYPEADWHRQIGINLTGTWFCMKNEITRMLEQGRGVIVNVASAAGLVGQPENVPYAASKFGIVGITRTAAIEYATRNIRINAVCPTAIETPMIMYGRRKLAENPEALEAAKNYQCMKRMGQPGEVADVILWLCSNESSFITGHAMPVDGGAFA
jgi:NAD(P)-dependent dehydrogenase (short-subunit alcohol dehydrogenase family)